MIMSRLFFGTGSILALIGALSAFAFATEKGERKVHPPDALREPGPTLPFGRAQAVAQARSGTRRFYVATETGLFASDDGGHRWDRLGVSPAGNADILAVAVDPLNEARLYIGGRGGLWQSEDGGTTWKTLSSPSLVRSAIRSIAIAPRVPETLYVGTDQEGIFRSPDGGASWIPARRGGVLGLALPTAALLSPEGCPSTAFVLICHLRPGRRAGWVGAYWAFTSDLLSQSTAEGTARAWAEMPREASSDGLLRSLERAAARDGARNRGAIGGR